MASLGLGWVGEPAVAAVLEPLFKTMGMSEQLLHTTAFLVGFVIFSSLHIVIGEQVPKTFAIRKPEPVSLWVAYPLHGFYLLAFPLNWALNRASAAILGLFNVEEATHADVLSDAELRGLISNSQEHGEIADQKAQMLSNLFAFDERTVQRVMIPRVDAVVLDLALPSKANMRTVRESGHSRFPVLDSSEEAESPVIGVVLAKDLYAAVLDGAEPWDRLREFCRDPLIVPETLRIGSLFETMRAKRAHMALVVDEYGDIVGVATLEDLLEEIVGDISDETDEPESKYPIRAAGDGWQAHGLASLADVSRVTGLTVPDTLDANTLSGLFIQRLGRMPTAGDVVQEGVFTLEVTCMKDNHVEDVALVLKPTAASEGPDTPAEE